MNSIGLVSVLLCYENNLKYINLYGRGVKKLTYLLQKCFDPLNISYSGCYGNSEGTCIIWLNSVQLSRRRCEDIHTYIHILSFIYIDKQNVDEGCDGASDGKRGVLGAQHPRKKLTFNLLQSIWSSF